jgi:hypothetical protein
MIEYTKVLQEATERAIAQDALNYYPDSSPFWDTMRGVEVLTYKRRWGLRATNTNADREAIQREREHHHARLRRQH